MVVKICAYMHRTRYRTERLMIKLLMTPTIDILAWKGNILFEQRYIGQFNDITIFFKSLGFT